jgi:lauroyl/myristoyl acyltransferase
MDWLVRRAPPTLTKAVYGGLGLGARLFYRLPGNHLRATMDNFCRLTGRDDPARLFGEFRRNTLLALSLFTRLAREGPEAVAQDIVFDEESLQRARKGRDEFGAGIFVVPHCAGSVLSATRFGREFPSVVLVRESKSEKRAAILRPYFEKLGPELLYVRRNDPAAIARGILKSLHDRKFVIGTTDLARKTADTVEVRMFGQPVHLPAWPARFSGRRKAPILPGYIRMQEGKIVLFCGEPYVEKDLAASTQRWAAYFEDNIRRSPADWLFMFDKRWSRIIAQAAGRA